MSKFADRQGKALLLIDVQNGVVLESESHVQKRFRSSFEETNLRCTVGAKVRRHVEGCPYTI